MARFGRLRPGAARQDKENRAARKERPCSRTGSGGLLQLLTYWNWEGKPEPPQEEVRAMAAADQAERDLDQIGRDLHSMAHLLLNAPEHASPRMMWFLANELARAAAVVRNRREALRALWASDDGIERQ